MSNPDTLQLHSLQEENRRLRRAVEELSILNDLAGAISASLNSQEIMQTIVRRSLRALNAEQGLVTLVEEQADSSMKTLIRANVSSSAHEEFHVNQALVGWMQLNKKPLLLNEPNNDQRFRGVRWDLSVKTLLCVPMMNKGALKGVLTVFNKKDGKLFSDEDQRLLTIIAAQSAQVIENARLNEREKMAEAERIVLEAENTRKTKELEDARTLQLSMLPGEIPQLPDYDIAVYIRTATEVGGDYYDFSVAPDGALDVALGDATGHGMQAGTVVTLMKGLFALDAPRADIRSFFNHCSRAIKQIRLGRMLMGFLLLRLKGSSISLANAGMPPVFLYKKETGCVEEIQLKGMPLGAMKEFSYSVHETRFEVGDTLLLLSDGLPEQKNNRGEMFDYGKVQEMLAGTAAESSGEIISRLVAACESWMTGVAQEDDITFVVIQKK